MYTYANRTYYIYIYIIYTYIYIYNMSYWRMYTCKFIVFYIYYIYIYIHIYIICPIGVCIHVNVLFFIVF